MIYKKLLLSLLLFIFFVNPSIVFPQVADTSSYELMSINFSGNYSISSGELKGLILSKETPFWFWKFLHSFTNLGNGPSYFDTSYISKDIKILENYYRDNGFFKNSISSRFEVDTISKKAYLYFDITENERSRVGLYKYTKLEKSLDSVFYHDFLWDKLSLKVEQYFSRDKVESDIGMVLTELKNFGYMMAEKENVEVVVDTAINWVEIEVNINKGKYYIIDTVLVEKKGEAKDNIEDELIYKIVDINKGDKYNLYEINQSQIRLYRTELFTSALINSIISDTLKNKVPLMVSLDVGKINELSPEFLINNQSSTFNLGIGVNYIRKNFFGEARKFTINGIFLLQDVFRMNFNSIFSKTGLNDSTILGQTKITVGIEQPYFIEKYITGKLEVFTAGEQQKIYKYFAFGSKLSFKFQLPLFLFVNTLSTSLLYENETIYFRKQYFLEALIKYYESQGIPYNEKDLQELIEDIYKNYFNQSNVTLGMDILALHSNDIFFPTLGYNLQINLENGGLIAMFKNLFNENKDPNTQFYKANLLFTTYTNPWKPAIGAVAYKLRLGYIHQYGGNRDIPVTKLFYSGGSNSIRGWTARQLGPVNQIVDEAGKVIDIIQGGGKFILEASIESRNRLIGDLGMAIFVDAGNNWNEVGDFTWKSTAIAAGIGIRYYTSFAPFRLDFGFKVYDPYTRQFNFNSKIFSNIEIHFGIGEAF